MPRNHLLPLSFTVLAWVWTLLPAGAAGLDISSETILRAFEHDRDNPNNRLVLPFYEYLGLDYGDSETSGFSVHFYGWGRTDLADSAFFEDDPDGELIYGYVDFRKPYDSLSGRLGRQHVFAGVTNESIDGLSITNGWGNLFSLTLFGGLPAAYGENHGIDGDLTYGGRVACLVLPQLEVGLSYQKLEENGTVEVEKSGIDLNLQKSSWLCFNGLSGYDLDNNGWREHRYDLQIVVDSFQIEPSFQYFQYEDYFDNGNSGTNLFHFLENSDEKLSIYGTDLIYKAFAEFSVGVRGRQYIYRLRDENAKYIAGLLTYSTFEGSEIGAEAGRMDGETPDNLYDLFRGFFYWHDPLELEIIDFLSADVLVVIYDAPVNSQENSTQITLGAGCKFFDDFMETRFSMIYSSDPYWEDDLAGVATLQINY